MGDFSILGGSNFKSETFGSDTSDSTSTPITAGSSHVKGSYIELIASTSFDYNSIDLKIREFSQGVKLLDIAIGGAGSEEVVIPNITVNFIGGAGGCASLLLPITVPEGSRISARLQAAAGGASMEVSGSGYGGSFFNSTGLGTVTDYGTVLGSSKGTVVDPGATTNTKGSWTELTSSTSSDSKECLLGIGINGNTIAGPNRWLVDIAIGGGGSEEIINSDIQLVSNTAEAISPIFVPIPIQVPTGTRLAIRSQCSTNDATDRLLTFQIYGVS